MSRMRTWLCCVLALASGCIVPRSMTMGQMAAPVGRGATDVGVNTGFLYASQTNPPFVTGQDAAGQPITTQEKTNAFSIPAFEANIEHGFSDRIGLNVHASSAGLQPGLKVTLNKSKIASVSLLPAIAFGYGSIGASTFAAGADGVQVETAPRSQTSFTFLGGLKVLFSHRSGFYAGLGYDFIFNRNYNAAILGGGNVTDKSEVINSTTSHQISAALGLDIKLGMVHVRPEISFAVYPGISQNITRRIAPNDTTVGATGGFGFAIFPGFTMAVVSPIRELTEEEEQEEAEVQKAEKRKKGDDAEGDDDDDEDTVKRPSGKKKARLDDDEEEDNARKKRRPAVDSDED